MNRRPEYTVLLLAVTLVALGAVTAAAKGASIIQPDAYLENAIVFFAAWLVFAAGQFLVALFRTRPDSPIRFLPVVFGKEYWATFRRGLPIIVGLTIFLAGFSAMKSTIPLFNDYVWDSTFIAFDRAVHGTDPWRILNWLFGYPIVTSAISVMYHLWVLLIYCGSIYWAFHVVDRKLVYRYFLSYLATWSIGGVVMATMLASVGPCFVGPILGMTIFDGQMAYLHEVNAQYPVMVLKVQQALLDWYFNGELGLGRGISAMPSMHVASSFLFYLGMRHINKRASYFFGAFCILIFIGSVHLGYHYAVDGYASIALTLIVWKLAGLVTKSDRAAETASPARAAEAC